MRDLRTLNKFRNWEAEMRMMGGAPMPSDVASGNGCFRIKAAGKSYDVIASDGDGWDHVSVVPRDRRQKCCPPWEAMAEIKRMFFRDDEEAIEYHPAKKDYVNIHPYCLHIWRPQTGSILKPPLYMV